jgi:hypothetical protein
MSWLKQISIGVLLLITASCSVVPTDGNDGQISLFDPRLGQISVETQTGRTEQIFRQQLERLLARSGSGETIYHLKAMISTSYPTDAVDMTARITLYNKLEGREVMNFSIMTSASVGAVTSLFGSDEAKANARERLAASLAEKTYQRLFLYFNPDESSNGS